MQQRIYDDPNRPLLKSAMKADQVVSSIPGVNQVANRLMRARKPEVAISTECGQGTPVPFPGDITVAQDRVQYYELLVDAYQARGHAALITMSHVIQQRDPLIGGPDYGPAR